MTRQPERLSYWERREAATQAAKLVDPYGQTSEEFDAFHGINEEPDENNTRAVQAHKFAADPRLAAAMETAIEAHDIAVTAVSEWLIARKNVSETVYRITKEEQLKTEVTEHLRANGYTVGPDANFTFSYPEES